MGIEKPATCPCPQLTGPAKQVGSQKGLRETGQGPRQKAIGNSRAASYRRGREETSQKRRENTRGERNRPGPHYT